ncbi:hypothetical protein VT06_04120 [Arsukibacterium sp. MJ3]|nr:hypothetical protein VT06_04120 [Arsukibacterium sp. MJ3]
MGALASISKVRTITELYHQFYTIYRTYRYAGRFVIVTNTFGAKVWVYFVVFSAHADSLVRALWHAHITINAADFNDGGHR